MKMLSRILLVATIAVIALACQNNNGETSAAPQPTTPVDTAVADVKVEKLTPADTVSAQAYAPTGDMARDAVTCVQVLYDKNVDYKLKDSVMASFTAYYTRAKQTEAWNQAVDRESRKLTGEEQVEK